MLNKLLEKLGIIRRKVFSFVQRILLVISLFFLYFIGFGITYLFCLIFKRNIIFGDGGKGRSFWKQPEGYKPDMQECLKQS